MRHKTTTTQTNLQIQRIKTTQTSTEYFTAPYHDKGQESLARVQPFYAIGNNEAL